MAFEIVKQFETDKVNVQQVYYEALDEMMSADRNVLHLEADLGMSVMGGSFIKLKKDHPDQVIDCGIQEANMIGMAAGMSVCGKVPFVHSFAPFVTRRACDQIFIACAYNKANVKLVGSDPGIMAAFNGGTHMPFEDLAIMRSIPEMTIVEFTDATMAKWLFPVAKEFKGNMYIRFTRKSTTAVYEPGSTFELGKANLLRDGKDVTIIASGIMVAEALQAAELLAAEGIDARVVDMFTIKPIDEQMVLESAALTGAIVTAENHNVIGGLGSAVCDVLCKNKPVPVEMVGVEDIFGQVGPHTELKEVYKLTAKDIAEKAKKAIARK